MVEPSHCSRLGEISVTVNPTIRICFSLAEAEPFYSKLERAGVATAFQRLIWLRLWQCELAPSRGATPIFVLVAEADGRPLMLLPLCQRRHWLLRIIEAADLGVATTPHPL
jgi:CelD/BcsL family acetyltransferase involved in cellulose biosynthesis